MEAPIEVDDTEYEQEFQGLSPTTGAPMLVTVPSWRRFRVNDWYREMEQRMHQPNVVVDTDALYPPHVRLERHRWRRLQYERIARIRAARGAVDADPAATDGTGVGAAPAADGTRAEPEPPVEATPGAEAAPAVEKSPVVEPESDATETSPEEDAEPDADAESAGWTSVYSSNARKVAASKCAHPSWMLSRVRFAKPGAGLDGEAIRCDHCGRILNYFGFQCAWCGIFLCLGCKVAK